MTEQFFDVVVVGGGPAGSTNATLLAKKGYSVLLAEKEKFPPLSYRRIYCSGHTAST